MNGATPARIGPNAITQVAGALERVLGAAPASTLLESAGLGAYVQDPPQQMVDEREVIALHSTLRARLSTQQAGLIAQAAGVATGDYLLAHRIPSAAQLVLRMLPARLASRALLAAITRHAWTFAGSGRFTATPGLPVVLTIEDCPICRGAALATPACRYYAATFTRLYQQLVHPRAVARETQCIATGGAACRFEIDWRATHRALRAPVPPRR